MMNGVYTWSLIIGTIAIMSLLTYGLLNLQDRRSATEKVGDAIHDLPQGVGKAERQLENRTPGQKLGDAVKDAGDKIKENSNP